MEQDIQLQAITALKAGRAVVFPTDTVYGLGVAVKHANSSHEVSALKHRDPEKPIAWLVSGIADLDRYGAHVSPEARRLAAEGWPGALTIIVEASDEVPPAYQSHDGTIGLRVPASETAQALIREVGPIAASSANRAGEPTARTFAELDEAITSKVIAIKADAEIEGTPSTVLDCTKEPPMQLR